MLNIFSFVAMTLDYFYVAHINVKLLYVYITTQAIRRHLASIPCDSFDRTTCFALALYQTEPNKQSVKCFVGVVVFSFLEPSILSQWLRDIQRTAEERCKHTRKAPCLWIFSHSFYLFLANLLKFKAINWVLLDNFPIVAIK